MTMSSAARRMEQVVFKVSLEHSAPTNQLIINHLNPFREAFPGTHHGVNLSITYGQFSVNHCLLTRDYYNKVLI